MNDTLKLPAVKPLNKKEMNIIRAAVDDEALEQLKDISAKTNISIQQLAERCIRFALEHVEIVEV